MKRGKALTVIALTTIVLLSWIYLLAGAATGMSPWAMSRLGVVVRPVDVSSAWTPAYALLMLVMWWIMMVAMMLPSAAPMIMLHARVAARGGLPDTSGPFVAGYLLAWLGFSLAATLLQWILERLLLSHPYAMVPATAWLAPVLLVAAGLYQLSPVKSACLAHCRAPAEFLARHWRNGRLGAVRMGLVHGGYCVGCCVGLMLLLFVGGVMNLIWIAGLAVLVLVEKLLLSGLWFARMTGLVLIASGLALAVPALFLR